MGDFIREHLSIVGAAVSLGMTIILALLGKTYAKKEELDKMNIRIHSMEEKINALPTVEQFHRVEIAVTELSGDIKEIKSAMTAIGNTTSLLLEKQLSEKN